MQESTLPASFRDPAGFLFFHAGKVYRQINPSYELHYQHLMQSGLYQALVEQGLLIPHEEVPHPVGESGTGPGSESCRILLPEQIPFISYPYEWCFSQLLEAARVTLRIQLLALDHGMSLKDASAYNIQFHEGRAIFIDTLSFEIYEEGRPWIAYRQFCQHFLAPLALMVRSDMRLLSLLREYIDGIPLDLASALLPRRTWFNYSLLAHIHLHARTQKRFADAGRQGEGTAVSMSKLRLTGLVSSLKSAVDSLVMTYPDTEWGNYYEDTNYRDSAMQYKEETVSEMLHLCARNGGGLAADIGANTGKFSRLAVAAGFRVLSLDVDEVAVDRNYRAVRESGEKRLLPLVLNLVNPSPGLGWANTERTAFLERARFDVVLALALVHHIAISNNVPLGNFAELLARTCTDLIIEFVPKTDSQVRRLLATREDIFPDYSSEGFEQAFCRYFDIVAKKPVQETDRTLYLMKVKP